MIRHLIYIIRRSLGYYPHISIEVRLRDHTNIWS
jgi:hypothetical protein